MSINPLPTRVAICTHINQTTAYHFISLHSKQYYQPYPQTSLYLWRHIFYQNHHYGRTRYIQLVLYHTSWNYRDISWDMTNSYTSCLMNKLIRVVNTDVRNCDDKVKMDFNVIGIWFNLGCYGYGVCGWEHKASWNILLVTFLACFVLWWCFFFL